MAVRYHVDEGLRLVTIRVDEQATAWQIAAVLEQILRDPLVGAGFNLLSDRRGLSRAPGGDYVRAALAVYHHYQPRLGPRKIAILIDPHEEMLTNVGHAAERYAEESNVDLRLFTDYAEAVQWLRSASVNGV